jgi:hypothetical protein
MSSAATSRPLGAALATANAEWGAGIRQVRSSRPSRTRHSRKVPFN